MIGVPCVFQSRQMGRPQFCLQQNHQCGSDARDGTAHDCRSVKGKKGGLRPVDMGDGGGFRNEPIKDVFSLEGVCGQKNRYRPIGTQPFHQIYRQEGFADRGSLDPDICRFRQ